MASHRESSPGLSDAGSPENLYDLSLPGLIHRAKVTRDKLGGGNSKVAAGLSEFALPRLLGRSPHRLSQIR
jgi:hypothetical protein